MLYLTNYYKSENGPGFKNYTFFIDGVHLDLRVGDLISIDRIDVVDQNPYFARGRQFINVNVTGLVSLIEENKSATDREIEEQKTDLPF